MALPLLLLAGAGAGYLRGRAKGKLIKRERKLGALEALSDLAGTLEEEDVDTFRRRGKSIAESYGMDTDEAIGMIEPFIKSFFPDEPGLGGTLVGGKAVKKTKLQELMLSIDELQERTGKEFTDEEETELLIRGLGLEAKAGKLPSKRTKTIKKAGKLFKQDYLVTPEGEKPYGEPYPMGERKGKAPENAWMNKLMEQMPAELASPEEKKSAWKFFETNRATLKNQGYDTDYMETQLIAAYGAKPAPPLPPIELPPERIKELSDIFPQYKYKAVPEKVEGAIRPPFIPERGAKVIPPFAEKPEDEEAIKARFSQDPAMQGYKLGKESALGYEVYDRKGNLVGYYK